ncbi:MAG: DUF1064 domain-containing protein [Candidatus Amulumruptor caecigallinarius]|nr:DUF1064 domain-containing protein [Candidatus Amulumruptor caecigallinarius]
MSKYGNVKMRGHDSMKEHRRAVTLRIMEKAGLISGLREQVPFILIPHQRDRSGKLIERACTYVADFTYKVTATGEMVVEDVKGFRTPEYRIKRKLMLHVYGVRIKET